MPDTRDVANLGPEEVSPLLFEMLQYWQSKRYGRAMPTRADIDHADIVSLLPHIGILDVVGPRLRCSLLGTRINEAFGSDHTGKHLDEVLSGERLEYFDGIYQRVVATGRPLYVENAYPVPDDTRVKVQRLLLPLSNDGSTVNKLLLVMDFGAQRRRTGIDCDSGKVEVTDPARYVDPQE